MSEDDDQADYFSRLAPNAIPGHLLRVKFQIYLEYIDIRRVNCQAFSVRSPMKIMNTIKKSYCNILIGKSWAISQSLLNQPENQSEEWANPVSGALVT